VVKQPVTGGRLTRRPEKGLFSVSRLRQPGKLLSKTAKLFHHILKNIELMWSNSYIKIQSVDII